MCLLFSRFYVFSNHRRNAMKTLICIIFATLTLCSCSTATMNRIGDIGAEVASFGNAVMGTGTVYPVPAYIPPPNYVITSPGQFPTYAYPTVNHGYVILPPGGFPTYITPY